MNTITKIKTKELPLQRGYMCSINLALVEGKEGYIVTENDLVHSIFTSEEEKIKIPVQEEVATILRGVLFSQTQNFVEVSIKFIKDNFLGEAVDLPEWIHYFGIKSRIESNYNIFQKSCQEIKAKINFPEWK